jgi:hypothetical protein
MSITLVASKLDMLSVYLVMTISLDDLSRALGSFLGALRKTVKSHHNSLFSFYKFWSLFAGL